MDQSCKLMASKTMQSQQPVAIGGKLINKSDNNNRFHQPKRFGMKFSTWSAIFLLLATTKTLLITRMSHYQANANPLEANMDMSLDGLSLSLSSGSSSSGSSSSASTTTHNVGDHHSTPQNRDQQAFQALFNKFITNDDHNDDFKLTGGILDHVASSMEQFAISEQMDQSKLAEGSLISSWLLKLSGGRQLARNPLIEKLISDLDYIYVSYYSKFRLLIQSIIQERPPEITIQNLGFRCERHAELVALQEMASSSSIYRLILDTFFSELYSHCVKRKFVIIKLSNIRPSSVVQQFVDIYLNLPTQNSYMMSSQSNEAALNDSELKALRELQTNLALNFDLHRSFEIHGPMQMAAQLVFDPNSALAMNAAQMDTGSLIKRFIRDCQEHVNQLGQVWGQFDQVAGFLSSPMNNLDTFNAKVKIVAPQLLYGSICIQLAQTVQ